MDHARTHLAGLPGQITYGKHLEQITRTYTWPDHERERAVDGDREDQPDHALASAIDETSRAGRRARRVGAVARAVTEEEEGLPAGDQAPGGGSAVLGGDARLAEAEKIVTFP